VMREGRIAFEHRTRGDGSATIARGELLAELGVLASRSSD
jgi:sulfonate transport system ATP-binding protein